MPAARHLLMASVARIPYDDGRRIAARAPYRLGAFALLALVTAWPVLATAASMNDFRDAQVLAHYESAARESVVKWKELPLWDPYYCGGMYLLGTPQSRFVSPTFLLTLLFGEARGEALAVFAMIVVGLEGTFRYARSRGATAFGAMLAAPVFALSGLFAVAASLGWVGFYGFELLPWIALGARQALEGSRIGVVILALAAAFCIGFGGTYAPPIAALWCGFEVATHLVVQRRRPQRLLVGLGVAAAGAILATGLSAARWLPVAETMSAARRIIGGVPGKAWADLALMLFWPTGGDNEHGSFYVGVLVIPAVILGLFRWRRSAALVIAGVLCVWLAAGYRAHPSLFAAMRDLPIYATLRYPERFLSPFALALAVVAARGISLAQALSRTQNARRNPRRATAATVVLTVAAVTILFDVGPLVSQHWARDKARSLSGPPIASAALEPFRQARGNRWALGAYEPMQRGSLSCWDAYPVPQSALLRGDLAAEEFLRDPDAGTVARRAWSPNAIDLDVRLARATTVVINQNWHSGWRTNLGEIASGRGLLTVALPAGEHRLSLRFAPRSAMAGGLASLVAMVGVLLLWLSSRRCPWVRGRREGIGLAVLAIAPALPLIAIGPGGIRGARALEPMTADAAGIAAGHSTDSAGLIADHPSDGSVRFGTKLEGGLVLEAVKLSTPTPAAGTDVILELDWRRGAETPRAVGVFVHIEPSKGDTLNADHVLLSGELDFEEAPPSATLRDVFPVHVPADSRGKTWKIWVGLWRVRQGDQRVRVVDWGSAIVSGDRILAATYEAR
jgi:hypothetical protein